MPKPLPKNATLKDLTASRDKSERFIRNVLKVMRKAQKDYGEIIVRMGTTGSGQAPNYRIEETGGHPIFAVNGANHDPWPEGEHFEGTDWSSATMSYVDVEEILRSLTGFKGAGSKRP